MKEINELERLSNLQAGGGDELKEVIDTACYVAGIGGILGFFFPPTALLAAAAVGYCAGYGGARLLLD